METSAESVLDMVNANLGGFNTAMGLKFVTVGPKKLVAELEIDERHKQPYGIVHGGVFAAMVETLCATGAALHVLEDGRSAVGLENATSFLRAVRSGVLRGTARPIFTGRRSHVWEAEIHDEENRLAATGRVRLVILEPGAEAGGEVVELQP